MCRAGKPTGNGSGRDRGGRYGANEKNFPTKKPKPGTKGVLRKIKSKLFIVNEETPDE